MTVFTAMKKKGSSRPEQEHHKGGRRRAINKVNELEEGSGDVLYAGD